MQEKFELEKQASFTLDLGIDVQQEDQVPISRRATLFQQKATLSKTNTYFANMFSPVGFASNPQTNTPSASPRASVQNLKGLFTYFLSERQETVKRINEAFKEAAGLIIEHTLPLEKKMSHLSTYVGALLFILKYKICHGDLKPENILWGDDKFVMSDFNGFIDLNEACALMRPEYRFENEEEKNSMKVIVQAFCSKSSVLEKVCNANPALVKKLENWGVLGNQAKLEELKSYLWTRCIPDSSPGYGSKLYLKLMNDYFWRGDKENYVKAAQALDIRAAGLTLYVILAGASKPKVEDDVEYYNTMQTSLEALGIPREAAVIIRRMSEPKGEDFLRRFKLPVLFHELERLEDILENSPQDVASMSIDFSLMHLSEVTLAAELEPEEDYLTTLTSTESTLTKLEKIQQFTAAAELSIIDDDTKRKKVSEKLLAAIEDVKIDGLLAKLDKKDWISQDARKKIIDQAFTTFPQGHESSLYIDGEHHTVLLLVDPDNYYATEVMIKKEMIGDGGSAVAYKTLSLRTLTYEVVKYAKELADPTEAERSQLMLSQIGEHEGVQPAAKTYMLDEKTVVIEPFYKNCDYGKAVNGEILCSRLQIPRDRWSDLETVSTHITRLNIEFQSYFLSNKSLDEKNEKFKIFESEYGSCIVGILGMQKATQLFEDYRSLIDTASPREEVEDIKEITKSPRSPRVTAKGFLAESISTIKKLTTKSRNTPPQSRRSSISKFDGELIAEEPARPSPRVDATTLEVVNVKAVEAILRDPTLTPDFRGQIIQEVRDTIIKTIRKCQGLILIHHLTASEDSLIGENPVTVEKEWRKGARNVDDKHLDLKGLNHISNKVAKIGATVLENKNDPYQKKLLQLLAVKEEVWKITS
ncbi:MAG: hypothetical protein LLF94_02070 [Chlamydiales bacterium]|nr:hypothetical protein [Chlamydiales bacterium]